MSTLFPPSPLHGGAAATAGIIPLPPPLSTETNSSPSSSNSSSVIIVIIIIAAAIIVSVGIYLTLQFFSKRFRRSFRTTFSPDDVVSRGDSSLNEQNRQPSSSNSLLESLPLFTFNSVSGNLTGGDCAVCLSKFEPHDQLRLLPLCCHAFHAECIDTWIISNQTCPLCRSMVRPSDSDILDKIQSMENPQSNRVGNSGSFRIEIGSISRRHGGAIAEAVEGLQRSYSIGGSFEYIVDENGYEVSVGSTTHRRGISDCNSVDKESSFSIPVPEPPGEALAAEVAGGRNWLRDYMDRLASASVSASSRAMSFRGSGRFFSGSSRRNEPVIAVEDLEANRAGEEISELFRWLSGI